MMDKMNASNFREKFSKYLQDIVKSLVNMEEYIF